MAGFDLVDSQGFFLVTQDGFVADDSCATTCCGSCPSWRELVQCDSGGSDPCTPPSQRHVWICSSVKCTNGENLTPGTVVFIDDHCFTVQPGTQPEPPPGADIITSVAPVQCVGSCSQSPCPQGDLWYRAVPCSPEGTELYVCGVTRCEIRGCYRIDPAVGGIHYSQIPPGARTVRIQDLGNVVSRTCCECETDLCANVPLTINDPPASDPCYGAAAGRTCCCSVTTPDGQGNRHSRGRLRVGDWTCHQVVRGGFGETITDVHIVPDSRQVDLNGCESFIVESVQTVNGGTPVVVQGIRVNIGCEVCGQWRLRAPRELIGPPFLPFQTITGSEGREWGESCQGYFSPETGETLSVDIWDATWECTHMLQRARYHYVNDFGSTIDTTFTFEAAIVRPNGSVGDSCVDRCGGNIVNGLQPVQTFPATVSGCGGCNKGLGKQIK